MSVPWKDISPDVGLVMVAISCMSVVLPAPLGPSRPTTPAPTSSDTSATAVMPPRNRLVTRSSLSMGSTLQGRWLTRLIVVNRPPRSTALASGAAHHHTFTAAGGFHEPSRIDGGVVFGQ